MTTTLNIPDSAWTTPITGQIWRARFNKSMDWIYAQTPDDAIYQLSTRLDALKPEDLE